MASSTTMMKLQLAKLAGVVALLARLALLEPAVAAGVKFTTDDLNSEASLWGLYQRWGAHYNVERDPMEKLRRFDTFKETAASPLVLESQATLRV